MAPREDQILPTSGRVTDTEPKDWFNVIFSVLEDSHHAICLQRRLNSSSAPAGFPPTGPRQVARSQPGFTF